MAKAETIRKILLMLSAAYPKTELSAETPGLYARMLADIDDELLEAATLDHISRNTFYPRINELRKSAADIATGVNQIPPAAEAWGNVAKAIPHFGRDNKPMFANPICEQAVNALGWRNLCASTNQISDRARFIEVYNQYKERAATESVTLPAVKALADKFRAPGLPAGHINPGGYYLESTDPQPLADYEEIQTQFMKEVWERGE